LPITRLACIIHRVSHKLRIAAGIKQKSRLLPRFLIYRVGFWDSLVRFDQRPNALGAKHLPHHLTIFENADSLKVGFEGTRGRFLGPGAVATKSSFLTTMCTFCHNFTSLLRFDRLTAA